MNLIRYKKAEKAQMAVMTEDLAIYDLSFSDFQEIDARASAREMSIHSFIKEQIQDQLPINKKISDLELLIPIETEEVWAAGVTYQKSRMARNYESSHQELNNETCYDKVYHAERPEIFLKSTRKRTLGPNQQLYLRNDSNWQVPEPELGLVINHQAKIVGYIIGNDLSCRDIEGENPLYLPQAKVWKGSCSIGPSIRLVETVENPYDLTITCRIYRKNELVFNQSSSTSQLKRKFDELVSYLVKNNELFDGVVLLSGTAIVPPDDFTLQDDDHIEIEIPEIGTLTNAVKMMVEQAAHC
ncbi:fumarylacetoacetate hydrolase family protein [Neobacillus sp. NPDC058068]|uniref:fumarylacetoacetate hydrolase family protein n=1 Tax=Neobacillus sp. NPDC058068 TaxID=3346325 RepID=UPI0036D768BA